MKNKFDFISKLFIINLLIWFNFMENLLKNSKWVNEFINIGAIITEKQLSEKKVSAFLVTPFSRYASSLVAFGSIFYKLKNQNLNNNSYIDFEIGQNLMFKEGNRHVAVVVMSFDDKQVKIQHKSSKMIQILPSSSFFKLSKPTTSNKNRMKSHSLIDVNKKFIQDLFNDNDIYNSLVNSSNLEVIIVGNKSAILNEVDQRILIPNKETRSIGCIDDIVRYKNDSSHQHWRTIIEPSMNNKGFDWFIEDNQLSRNPIGIIEGDSVFNEWRYLFEYTSLITIMNREKNTSNIIINFINDLKRENFYGSIESKLFKSINSELITINHE